MASTVQETITRRVCEIPVDFESGTNKSVVRLLKESGYPENRELLTRDSVRNYLREHRHLIKEWQKYSESQRRDRGWYFTTDKSDVEVLAFFVVVIYKSLH